MLRHHAHPQTLGVPLAIALGWYNVGYGTFAVMESILSRSSPRAGERSRALVPATALVATSLDLLLDPCGLELGLWEWTVDGPYAPDVQGPNGKRGVPLLNFAGWLFLISGVTLAYLRLTPGRATGGPKTGRSAALLLVSYYLPAAAWTLKRRRWRHLVHSAPFAAALWAASRLR